MRKPPPISTSSPRETTTSRPAASASSASRTAAALLLTTSASSRAGQLDAAARATCAVARAARAVVEIVLEVGEYPGGAAQRAPTRRVRERCAAEVRVQHDARRVDHPAERRLERGGDPCPHRGGELVSARGDAGRPLLLDRATRRLHDQRVRRLAARSPDERVDGRVGARHRAGQDIRLLPEGIAPHHMRFGVCSSERCARRAPSKPAARSRRMRLRVHRAMQLRIRAAGLRRARPAAASGAAITRQRLDEQRAEPVEAGELRRARLGRGDEARALVGVVRRAGGARARCRSARGGARRGGRGARRRRWRRRARALDEAQQVEERALAEHVQQQRGGAEVALVEQRVQRQLGGGERVAARRRRRARAW